MGILQNLKITDMVIGTVVVGGIALYFLIPGSGEPQDEGSTGPQTQEQREGNGSNQIAGNSFTAKIPKPADTARSGGITYSGRGSAPTADHWKARLDEIRQLLNLVERQEALEALGREMAASDLAAAYDLLNGFANLSSSDKGQIIRGILYVHAQSDVEVALRKVGEFLPERPEGNDSQALRDYHYKYADYQQAMWGLLGGWGARDPESALSYIDEQLPERVSRSYSLRAVYGAWATTDPAAALQKASALDTNLQIQVVPEIYATWATKDPWTAANQAGQLAQGALKTMIQRKIMANWTAVDADQALNWANDQYPDAKAKDDFVLAAAHEICWRSPESAAKLFDSLGPENPQAISLLSRLVTSWGHKDPQAAGNWVLDIEDDSQRSHAIKASAASWTRRDPKQALDWALAIPEGNDRAYALSNVAVQQAQRNMSEPLEWIGNLSPGFSRDRAAAGYVLGYMRIHDRNASTKAKEAMDDSAISMEDVGKIINTSSIAESEKKKLRDLLD